MIICSVRVIVAFSYFAAVSYKDFEITEMFWRSDKWTCNAVKDCLELL